MFSSYTLSQRSWIPCKLHRILPLLFLLEITEILAACLPNATEASGRKNLRTGTESYPVGLWPGGGWTAAQLTSKATQIIIEEKLGYNVELKGPGSVSADAFFALMGCTTPLDGASRGCGAKVTYVHISLEVWTTFYADTWNQVQTDFPEVAPLNLGSMGYNGVTALYIPSAVQQRAYEADSINLDFFRDYNASRQRPWKYFASPGDLNASQLLPCNESILMSSEVMREYAEITNDWAGVVVDGGEVIGKCFNNHFWLAPACRADAGTCLTWLTAGSGWGMSEMLIKATAYNIPLATTVASSMENYQQIPTDFDMLLYWWVPDPTFLRLQPRKITFPDHDADEWAKGDRRSAAYDVSVDKLVSWDLNVLAPDVRTLIDRFKMSLKTVDKMMLDQLDTADSDYDVACRWLQSNEEIWTDWLPERGKCFSQFGIYDGIAEKFLQTREGSTTCRACPSGRFSAPLIDDQGTTFTCQECASGHFQDSGASVSCNPCPAGSYQNRTGSISCSRCPAGEYQDQKGSIACKPCPAYARTALLGSDSISDCGCEDGFINTAENGDLHCVPCGEGLECPFASSTQTLQSGRPSHSSQSVTRIRRGYFATAENPLEIFICRPEAFCPGGTPGTCAGGLEGVPCAHCPDGMSRFRGECADCHASWAGWIGAMLVYLVIVPISYFMVNTNVTAQATPFKTAQMSVGLCLTAMQVVAVLGLMSARWPDSFATTSSGFQILILDLDGIGFSCLVGSRAETSYLATTLIIPCTLLWLAFCHAVSICGCLQRIGLKPWKLAFTLNTMGLGLQIGFGSIAAVALKPMMCYKHPTGGASVLSYPDVTCGGEEHGLMLACGIFLLSVFVVGFIGACCYAVWNLPQWSAMGHHWKVQSVRFCTANFRFDSYWFSLFLLLRGLGFALAILLGTDVPSAQTSMATVVLIIYAVMQAAVRPWKAPAVNLADMILSAGFVILVNTDIQVDEQMESEFAEYIAQVVLLLNLTVLALLGLLCMVGLSLELAGARWNKILHLCAHGDPTEITEALRNCAQTILDIETATLYKEIGDMNSYDVQTILNLISLVAAEIKDGSISDPSSIRSTSSSRATRVTRKALNARLSVVPGNGNSVRLGSERTEGYPSDSISVASSTSSQFTGLNDDVPS